jgi:hypothetical protein
MHSYAVTTTRDINMRQLSDRETRKRIIQDLEFDSLSEEEAEERNGLYVVQFVRERIRRALLKQGKPVSEEIIDDIINRQFTKGISALPSSGILPETISDAIDGYTCVADSKQTYIRHWWFICDPNERNTILINRREFMYSREYGIMQSQANWHYDSDPEDCDIAFDMDIRSVLILSNQEGETI